MKASLVFISLLSVSTLSLTPTIAAADPGGLNILIKCPRTGAGPNVLTNFGDYVAGYGAETIHGITNPIYFKSITSIQGVPTSLNAYGNEAAAYDSTNGNVTCQFGSSENPGFTVAYTLTNGKGGFVTNQGRDFVEISLPVGLRG